MSEHQERKRIFILSIVRIVRRESAVLKKYLQKNEAYQKRQGFIILNQRSHHVVAAFAGNQEGTQVHDVFANA